MTRTLLILAALLWPPWSETHAYPCGGLDESNGFPQDSFPLVVPVQRGARMVCMWGGADLLAAKRIEGGPAPADCRLKDGKLACVVGKISGLPDDIYVLRDSEGWPHAVEMGREFPLRYEPYPGRRGTATFDHLRVVSKGTLRPWLGDEAPQAASTCYELPSILITDPSLTLFPYPGGGTSSLSIIELMPARNVEPPDKPRLTPVHFQELLMCRTYGAVRFEPLLSVEGVHYLWHLENGEGKKIKGPYLARVPTAGVTSRLENGLDFRERYILVAQAMNLLGQTSEPVRIPFELLPMANPDYQNIPGPRPLQPLPRDATETPRLVRDTSTPDHPTVADQRRKLVWQGCVAGLSGEKCGATAPVKSCLRNGEGGAACTWAQALQYCEKLTWAGKSDWRLPDRDELRTLIDRELEGESARIDANTFPNASPSRLWSSSTVREYPDNAWVVPFGPGTEHAYAGKSYTALVRCVRDEL